jgi:hypothetical protein
MTLLRYNTPLTTDRRAFSIGFKAFANLNVCDVPSCQNFSQRKKSLALVIGKTPRVDLSETVPMRHAPPVFISIDVLSPN